MTRDEAIEAYIKKFGWWPSFLMMGVDDDQLVKRVEIALKTGERIKPMKGVVY